MKTWKIVVIPTAITLTVGGIYLFTVWRHRQNPGVVGQKSANQQTTMDDVAVVRMEFQQHFEDVQDLVGKSVWMKNGYTIPYFPYGGSKVEFTKSTGLIPSLQKLDVRKVIKVAVPASVDTG